MLDCESDLDANVDENADYKVIESKKKILNEELSNTEKLTQHVKQSSLSFDVKEEEEEVSFMYV